AAAGEGRLRRRVVATRLEPRLLVLTEDGALARLDEPQRGLGRALPVCVAEWVGDRGQDAERQLLAGNALDPHAPIGQLQVVRRDLEHARPHATRVLAARARRTVD